MQNFLIIVGIAFALVLLIFAGKLLYKHFITDRIRDKGGMINPEYIINGDNQSDKLPNVNRENVMGDNTSVKNTSRKKINIGGINMNKTISVDENLLVCGDYSLLYKDCKILKNNVGANTLVITYDYTNNSNKEDSYGRSLVTSMTQVGIELNTTTVWNGNNALTQSAEEKVAPGKTIEVHDTVVLQNIDDDVILMVGEMFGDDTDTLTIHLPK